MKDDFDEEKPVIFQKEIDASHPMAVVDDPIAFKADVLAMELVGERYAKRDLVNLVRWLIMDESKTARQWMERPQEVKKPKRRK